MKPLFQRVLTVCISAFIIAGILAGCGQEGSKQQEGGASDDKGKSNPISIKVIKCGYGDKATENDIVWNEINKQFKESTGLDIKFDIEFLAWEDTTSKYNTKIAAKERMDAIQTHSGILDILTKQKEGPLVALDEKITELAPDLLRLLPKSSFEAQKRNGKIMALPQNGYSASYYFAIRKDKLDEWGLAMPTSLQEFENLMAEIKKRDPDCVPLTGAYWALERNILALCNLPELYHNSLYLDNSDGKVKPLYFHPDYHQFIETYERWTKNKWISKDASAMAQEAADQMFAGGKSYIKADNIPIPLETQVKEMKKANPNTNIVMIPPMKGYDGKARVHYENPAVLQYCIPRTSDPKAADAFIKYYNWSAANPKNYRLTTAGVEGTHFTVENGILQGFDKYKNLGEEGPYRGLYAFFTNTNSDYTLYSSETPKEVIDAFGMLEKAEKTASILDGKPFDLASIGTKYNEADGAAFGKITLGMIGKKDPAVALEEAKKVFMDKGGQEVIDEFSKQYDALYKTK